MNSLIFALTLVSLGNYGNQPIEPTTLLIDLQLGSMNHPPHILVPLEKIHAAVTFQRAPHILTCPADRRADFDLEKVDPAPGRFGVVERISFMCTRIDSISIDTSIVYIIHNAYGGKYYMRMLERVGEKARVRLTSELPVTVRDPEPAPGAMPGEGDGPAYRLDGKALEKQGSGDAAAGTLRKSYRRPSKP